MLFVIVFRKIVISKSLLLYLTQFTMAKFIYTSYFLYLMISFFCKSICYRTFLIVYAYQLFIKSLLLIIYQLFYFLTYLFND